MNHIANVNMSVVPAVQCLSGLPICHRPVDCCEPLSQACCSLLFVPAGMSHPSSHVVLMQVSESDIDAPSKPLNFRKL